MKSLLSNFRITAPSSTGVTSPPSSHSSHSACQPATARDVSGHLGDLRDLVAQRHVGGEAGTGAGAPARMKTLFRGGANAGVGATTRTKINSLRSGAKIHAPNDPRNTLDQLPAEDIMSLAVAMNFAKPGEAGSTRSHAVEIQQRLGTLANDLDNNFIDHDNNAFLDHAAASSKLTDGEVGELRQLMDQTHMSVKARTFTGPNGQQAMLDVYFNGTQNLRDVRQDMNTALGMTGEVDHASRRIGELMSKMLAPNGNATLLSVSGLSMGGGAAQIFMAAIDSRVELSSKPAVVLLDPVLLNNRQAQLAVQGGTRPVDFSEPRGVAITLDYARNPQRGVMSMMKSAGFHSPGLVRLKLGLEDGDGQHYHQAQPKPRFGLGYHGREAYYVEAMRRFSGTGEAATALGAGRPAAMGGGSVSASPLRPPMSGPFAVSPRLPRPPLVSSAVQRPVGPARPSPVAPHRIGTAARLNAATDTSTHASTSSPDEESYEDVLALWLKADARIG
jgi:hypothetical protein